MLRRSFLLALVAIAVARVPEARGQQWKLGVDGGRIRTTIDPLARASESLVAGLGYENPTTAFRISTGVPTRSAAPYWGALGAWRRLAAKRKAFVLGADLSGNAFAFVAQQRVTTHTGGPFDRVTLGTTTTSGRAIAGQALPILGIETDAFQLHARAGMSVYNASTRPEAERNRAVRLGEIQLTMQPSPTLALIPVARRFEARNEPPATFAGASSVVAEGRLTVWGSAGQWLSAPDSIADDKTEWSVGSRLRVTERASITGTARHDSFDPLYLNPPQTSWSVGLSILIGNVRSSREPVPAAYENGVATIRLPASLARSQPRVAGDFNKWTPAPMARDGDFWIFRVATQPGVYNYAFVSPEGTWYVPDSVPGRKDDGMGGHVAVLVIR